MFCMDVLTKLSCWGISV